MHETVLMFFFLFWFLFNVHHCHLFVRFIICASVANRKINFIQMRSAGYICYIMIIILILLNRTKCVWLKKNRMHFNAAQYRPPFSLPSPSFCCGGKINGNTCAMVDDTFTWKWFCWTFLRKKCPATHVCIHIWEICILYNAARTRNGNNQISCLQIRR